MRVDRLRYASVTIQVHDNDLYEHLIESEDDKTALSYVEAVSGARFSVVLVLEPKFAYRDEDLQFRVFLDGRLARSYMIRSEKMKEGMTKSLDAVREYADGFSSYSKSTFAENRSTDGNVDQSLLQSLSKIGEVTITLKPCRISGRTKKPEMVTKFKEMGEDGLPEQALKGRSVSYHAQPGEAERMKSSNEIIDVTYPYGTMPVATYTFRYRSLRDLHDKGIIERSLSPVALEDRNPEDLTPAESCELIRRLLAEKETASKMKPDPEVKLEKALKRQRSEAVGDEDEEDDCEEELSVTKVVTPNTKRAKTASKSSEEVMDLTGE